MDDVDLQAQQPVRALLFDLGGVVINFDFGGAFRSWAARAGCDPSLIAQRFSLDDSYKQHERGEIAASSYFASLRQSLQIDLSDMEFAQGWNDVYLGPVPVCPRCSLSLDGTCSLCIYELERDAQERLGAPLRREAPTLSNHLRLV